MRLAVGVVTDVKAPSSSIHEFIQRPVSSDQVSEKSGVASSKPGIKSQQ